MALVLVTIAVLITAMILIGKETDYFRTQAGLRSLNVFNDYQKGERFLLYIDQSAKYAAYNAIFEIAGNGGFIGASECGDYKGYNMLNNVNEQSCIPLYEENIRNKTIENLKKYMDIYPAGEKALFMIKKPYFEYDLLFYEENLIGTTMDEVSVKISGRSAVTGIVSTAGLYTINPSFNVDIGYDIIDYDFLTLDATVLIIECKGQDNMEGLVECIKKNKPDNWQLREDLIGAERMLAFDATSSYNLIKYNEADGFAYLNPVVYKFAIYFPS